MACGPPALTRSFSGPRRPAAADGESLDVAHDVRQPLGLVESNEMLRDQVRQVFRQPAAKGGQGPPPERAANCPRTAA